MENLFNLLENSGITTHQEQKSSLLNQIGLNWEVKKERLLLEGGQDSGYFGIVRQDNRKVFATCKDTYETFQNAELLELVNEAAGKLGLSVNKGGSFKGGALAYLQIKTGQLEGIGENSDTVQKYVTAINSHDGSCSLRWGIYNFTVSCSNQIWHLKKALQNSVKHTSNMRLKIDEIMHTIEEVQKQEKKLYEIYWKLASAPMKQEHFINTVQTALDIDMTKEKKDLSTYQVNRLNDLTSAIRNETNQKGRTLWGLFSGVTKYTTHYIPGGETNRLQSKAIGKGANIDNAILKQLAKEIV